MTIPRAIRQRAELDAGDRFEVEIVDEGILLRPQPPGDAARDSGAIDVRPPEDEDADTGYDRVSKSDQDFFSSLEL